MMETDYRLPYAGRSSPRGYDGRPDGMVEDVEYPDGYHKLNDAYERLVDDYEFEEG